MLPVRAAGARLAGTLLPVAGTLVAGTAPAGGPGFNRVAGLATGVLLATGVVVFAALRIPAAAADPDVGEPGDGAGTIPAPGTTVRVHTHFGPRGGYVRHDGLLVWAVPGADGGWADFTPGEPCLVAGSDRAVLTVIRPAA